MDRIPTELLVDIISLLPSQEIIASQSVNRSWYQTLNSNLSVWQSLDLLSDPQSQPQLIKILEIYQKKNRENLKSIKLDYHLPLSVLTKFLTRSFQSLVHVSIGCLAPYPKDLESSLIINCPNLKVLKMIRMAALPKVRVLAVTRSRLEFDEPSSSPSESSNLESLWISHPHSNLFKHFRWKFSSSNPLPYLTKLSIGEMTSETLRDLLSLTSSTLKFLRFNGTQREDNSVTQDLILSNLKVIELYRGKYCYFPKWLKPTSTHTLILATGSFGSDQDLEHFPQSITNLWLLELFGRSASKVLKVIGKHFDGVKEVRMEQGFNFDLEELLEIVTLRLDRDCRLEKLVMDLEKLDQSSMKRLRENLGVELKDVKLEPEWIEL